MNNTNELSINTVRVLAAEMIQRANSGHPGLPLGAAPAAFTLWRETMKHNPENPDWPDRDRFILSAGHGSSLLYSMLHLFGYGLTMEDLKAFRQLGSLTPGHPERGHTKGVEITTGPLGQGIANAVGMALAEKYLAGKFNKNGYCPVDHYTYVLHGDGCLMEGISYEAASLAGTLRLNKLIMLYDSNNITIEGSTETSFTENIALRFEAMGWDYTLVEDGNNCAAVLSAIESAKASGKPSLIEIKTQIGFGAPNKQGKASAHGEPLGADELILLKQGLGIDITKEFHVPEETRADMREFCEAAAKREAEWNKMMAEYKAAVPELYAEWCKWHEHRHIELLNDEIVAGIDGKLATRAASGQILNRLSELLPNLIGGSADLAPSNNSLMKNREYFSDNEINGSNLHFGVREHAMTAIANGMAAHGGLRPYIAGFFVFSDYMKPSMRLSALMKLPVIHILTHDSIGVGEDGPTHQPIEQLTMLRSIPNMNVIRPADNRETAAAWQFAINCTDGPSALVLSRQALNPVNGTGEGALRGGYIVSDCDEPEILLIASGSELELADKAKTLLAQKGKRVRLVSMPCVNIFEAQSEEYRESVLPKAVRKRVIIEAGSDLGWGKYAGLDGAVIAMNRFGASAPANRLFEEFGFTVDNIVETAMKL